MKVSAQHYGYLKDLLVPVYRQMITTDYMTRTVLTDPRVKDPGKRFRWDAVYRVKGLSGCLYNDPYSYDLTDQHIDTALRKIVSEVAESLPTHNANRVLILNTPKEAIRDLTQC